MRLNFPEILIQDQNDLVDCTGVVFHHIGIYFDILFICVNPFLLINISEDCLRFSHSDSFSINGKFYNELSGAIISANPLFPAPFLAVVCSGRVVGLQFPLGEPFLLSFLLEKYSSLLERTCSPDFHSSRLSKDLWNQCQSHHFNDQKEIKICIRKFWRKVYFRSILN